MNKGKKIGIIGGKGKFGKLITSLFKELEIQPIISDRDTEVTNIELVKQVDVIIIAVPIDVTLDIIKEISPYVNQSQVIIDITSIKQPFMDELLNTKADIISIHPMFNPSVEKLENQTVIIIPARDRTNWVNILSNFCSERKIKIKITSAEHHDKMMALIQVLIHFNTISIGVTLAKLGFDIQETLEFTSPIYRMELAMIGRIFAQDGRLYGNIPMYNLNTPEILLEHKLTLEHISKLIITKNLHEFVEVFDQTSIFFKDFKNQAMNESNYIINKLGECQKS